MAEKIGQRVDLLVAQSILLRGDDPEHADQYQYCESVCAHCKKPIEAEGQEALQAMATARSIFFRVKLPCKCGCKTGVVRILHDSQVEAYNATK